MSNVGIQEEIRNSLADSPLADPHAEFPELWAEVEHAAFQLAQGLQGNTSEGRRFAAVDCPLQKDEWGNLRTLDELLGLIRERLASLATATERRALLEALAGRSQEPSLQVPLAVRTASSPLLLQAYARDRAAAAGVDPELLQALGEGLGVGRAEHTRLYLEMATERHLANLCALIKQG